MRNRVYEFLQSLSLRRANAVIAVSAPLVGLIAKLGVPRDRIRCIRNGFAPLVPTLTRSAARRALAIGADTLVAGWVGRLSPEKGADVMLAALAESGSGWQLSVIGDGEERDDLRNRAAKLGLTDRVTWHGAIANAGSLMAAFDAYVLSSHTEGTPITLLEAMSARVPIIATSVGGVPDIVNSSQAILVPANDPGAIARALSLVHDDRHAADERARRAHERLGESFDAGAWQRAVDSVYESV